MAVIFQEQTRQPVVVSKSFSGGLESGVSSDHRGQGRVAESLLPRSAEFGLRSGLEVIQHAAQNPLIRSLGAGFAAKRCRKGVRSMGRTTGDIFPGIFPISECCSHTKVLIPDALSDGDGRVAVDAGIAPLIAERRDS
jgi:hypothetical protein